jgi:hypothetical protein
VFSTHGCTRVCDKYVSLIKVEEKTGKGKVSETRTLGFLPKTLPGSPGAFPEGMMLLNNNRCIGAMELIN